MSASDFAGNVVFFGTMTVMLIGMFWLPYVRRKEMAAMAEQNRKPNFTEIRGSITENPDGSPRSTPISGLTAGTVLQLQLQESENKTAFSYASVNVLTVDGEILGQLPSDISREFGSDIGSGKNFDVKIDILTGGTEKNPDFYIKLVLKKAT
jgi:hypothetical protein